MELAVITLNTLKLVLLQTEKLILFVLFGFKAVSGVHVSAMHFNIIWFHFVCPEEKCWVCYNRRFQCTPSLTDEACWHFKVTVRLLFQTPHPSTRSLGPQNKTKNKRLNCIHRVTESAGVARSVFIIYMGYDHRSEHRTTNYSMLALIIFIRLFMLGKSLNSWYVWFNYTDLKVVHHYTNSYGYIRRPIV